MHCEDQLSVLSDMLVRCVHLRVLTLGSNGFMQGLREEKDKVEATINKVAEDAAGQLTPSQRPFASACLPVFP